jgi:hypothetical protein
MLTEREAKGTSSTLMVLLMWRLDGLFAYCVTSAMNTLNLRVPCWLGAMVREAWEQLMPGCKFEQDADTYRGRRPLFGRVALMAMVAEVPLTFDPA